MKVSRLNSGYTSINTRQNTNQNKEHYTITNNPKDFVCFKNKNVSFGSSFGVKVCGTCDKPSVLAELNAAKEAKSDKLIIGCLIGLTHNAKGAGKLDDEQAADLIKYIRQTSYSMKQPVKIACVNHCTDADTLISHISTIENKVLNGSNGLIAQAKKANKNKELGYPDTSSLTRKPLFEIIQIHDNMPINEIRKVKQTYPDSKIIKAVHIPKNGEEYDLEKTKESAVKLAKEPSIDGLLLDSANLSTNQIGGTGLLNNWDVAREVIDEVHKETGKPVAMAGGLSPDNSKEAIEKTHADMIDANSGWRFDRNKSNWKKLNPEETPPKDAFGIYSVLKQFNTHVSTFFENHIGS